IAHTLHGVHTRIPPYPAVAHAPRKSSSFARRSARQLLRPAAQVGLVLLPPAAGGSYEGIAGRGTLGVPQRRPVVTKDKQGPIELVHYIAVASKELSQGYGHARVVRRG